MHTDELPTPYCITTAIKQPAARPNMDHVHPSPPCLLGWWRWWLPAGGCVLRVCEYRTGLRLCAVLSDDNTHTRWRVVAGRDNPNYTPSITVTKWWTLQSRVRANTDRDRVFINCNHTTSLWTRILMVSGTQGRTCPRGGQLWSAYDLLMWWYSWNFTWNLLSRLCNSEITVRWRHPSVYSWA